METKINLITGVFAVIVTIITSIGGSYVTTKITLAQHDLKIANLEKQVSKIERNIESNTTILNRIDKAVAVIEERTKTK